jgi:Rrf2 family protein
LAAFFDLPPAYLNKQLQALVRAEILTSTSGPRGGFRLARTPERITLLDLVTAIDGAEPAFRCTQILKQSPLGDPKTDYHRGCTVSQAMRKAELAWRGSLADQTLAELKSAVERRSPATVDRTRRWFEESHG